jgi:pimeloyl-ACP methyl ester carboxylesterase
VYQWARLLCPDLPIPDKLQDLLDKLGTFDQGFTGWSDDEIREIAAPTLITVGDCDAVTLEHAVRFLQLRGGDVNGDFVGVPASQLAVFPGTTHFFGMARTTLVPRCRDHLPRRCEEHRLEQRARRQRRRATAHE